MRFAPMIIFFFYVYLEISFFVLIANHIGVLLALFGIIVTSIAGLSLVKSQGMKNFYTMQEKMMSNQDPSKEMMKGTSLFLAGFFLLIPGFLTDIIALVFMLPPVQLMLSRFIVPKARFATRFTYYRSYQQNRDANPNVIEGQFSRRDDE